MSEKTTQNKAIAKHLFRGYGLTPLQALAKFGCLRLAARINDLRGLGFVIDGDFKKVGTKKVMRYTMPKEWAGINETIMALL